MTLAGCKSGSWTVSKIRNRIGLVDENGANILIALPWRIAATGDFNGDGKPDILWQHDAGGLQIWFMDGLRLGTGSACRRERREHSDRAAVENRCDRTLRSRGDQFQVLRVPDPRGSLDQALQGPWAENIQTADPRLTVSPNMANAGQNQIVINAFQTWSNATVPTPGASPCSRSLPWATPGGCVVVSPGQLPTTPFTILGQTTADGTSIVLSNTIVGGPLPAVATHEAGHALGLLHSTNPASVMFPFGTSATLDPQDIAAIRALYGWLPQIPIPGIGTVASPALCACGKTLVLAWRGSVDDDRIYVSQSVDGSNWSPQRSVPGAGSADGPTLAWDGVTLWLAHRGIPGDDGLYWATSRDCISTGAASRRFRASAL